MKKVILIVALLFMVFNNLIKAQFIEPIEYLRFDSVSTIGNINGIIEDTGFYYLHDNSKVVSLNKATGLTDTIFDTGDYIRGSFIDSNNTPGILLNNKIMYWQNNNWLTVNIGNLWPAKYCMVDGAGVLWIAIGNDSLFSYNNGNWSKYKLNFSLPNEDIDGLILSSQHECLIYTYTNNLVKIYQPLSLNLTLLYEFPWCGYYNCYFEIDALGRVWYLNSNIIKYKNSSGAETQITSPQFTQISSFRISENLNELWAIVRTDNVDSLYFFDGNIWLFSYSKYEYNIPFKTKTNHLLLKNYNISSNGENQVSTLRVFDGHLQNQIYTFAKSMIASEVTSILVDDNYYNSGLGEFLIGTHNGIVRKKYNYGSQNSYQIWDSTNSALPTNHIYDMQRKYEFSMWEPYDTLFLATNSGLIKALFNEDSLQVIEILNSQNSALPFDTVTALFIEGLNGIYANIWLGSNNKGAALLNSNNIITVYDTSNSLLPSNHVMSISSNSDIVCIVTDKGFMTIKDSIQQVYTIANSGLLTENINFVEVYQGYNAGGSNNYDLLIGTNGFGFAILDASNQWFYYNTSNQNFDSDTVYYLRKNVAWLFDNLLGTNNGLKSIGGNFNNITYYNFNIQNAENNKRNIDSDYKEVPCAGFGNRFGSLCEKGIIRYQVCFGSMDEKKSDLSNFNAWFKGKELYIKTDVNGDFDLNIFDITGKSILNKRILFPCNNPIILPEIAEGIYLLRLSNEVLSYSNKILFTK